MPDHSHLGRLSYAQVGNLDVYFGDWSNVAPGAAVGTKGTNYTAFYSGTGRTTNLPTTGTATYTVKGINQYHTQNTALLNGTLKADFGKRTLNGEMKRTGLNVAINNATINTAQASFSGKVTANKVPVRPTVISSATKAQRLLAWLSLIETLPITLPLAVRKPANNES